MPRRLICAMAHLRHWACDDLEQFSERHGVLLSRRGGCASRCSMISGSCAIWFGHLQSLSNEHYCACSLHACNLPVCSDSVHRMSMYGPTGHITSFGMAPRGVWYAQHLLDRAGRWRWRRWRHRGRFAVRCCCCRTCWLSLLPSGLCTCNTDAGSTAHDEPQANRRAAGLFRWRATCWPYETTLQRCKLRGKMTHWTRAKRRATGAVD